MAIGDPVGLVTCTIVYGYLAYFGYWFLFQRGKPGYETPEPKALYRYLSKER